MTKDKSRLKPLTAKELAFSTDDRAKEWCREQNLIWHWCEYYDSRARRKRDLFGLFDMLYFATGTPQMIGVQVTGGGNGRAREKKMLGKRQPHEKDDKAGQLRRMTLWAWLLCGNRAEVWDYRERRRGGIVVDVERVVLPLESFDL